MKTVQRDRQNDESFVSRSFHIERLLDDKKQEATYRVSLSSEAPVKDWPWAPPNVLVHERSAVDLEGVSERGLPLFVNHEARTLRSMVGRILNLRLERKRLVGELKFSRANPDAEMVREMVDEGTLTDMSIRAEPIKVQRTEGSDGNVESVKWLRWRPLEGSVVGIGADQSIGIGRQVHVVEKAASAKGVEMDEENEVQAGAEKSVSRQAGDAAVRVEAGKQQQDERFAARMEQERIEAIRKLGQANAISEDITQAWIGRGMTFEQIADDILEIQKKRGEKGNYSLSALDLSEREKRQYSLSRAILAAAGNDNWRDAGFELECHTAISDKLNRHAEKGHFFVPLDVQRRHALVDGEMFARAISTGGLQTLHRELTAGNPASAGYLVGTRVMGFDEVLRNTSVLMRMGATTLPGLRDNVAIPRQTAAAIPEWLTTETGGPNESLQTFTQLPLAPKTVAALTGISRKLLLQSSIAVDSLVNSDLGAAVALSADKAGLSGTGVSGQPLGLDSVSGVGSVTGTSLDFADILEFQTDVASGNVTPARPGYVTTPTVAGYLIARVKYSGTASPIWEGNIWAGSITGIPALSSNQVEAAVAYFGDWSKLVVAEWGTLEIDTNPYGSGFGAGVVSVRAIYSLDIGVRYPVAFSRAASIT